MTIKNEREYRGFNFELRENQETKEMIVEGVPIVYEQATVLWECDGVKYYEVIARDALKEADMSDVIMNINHEGRPVARLRNSTLKLEDYADGLHIRADLHGTELGRSLFEEIKGGYIDKMSFAFSVKESSYDVETHTRTITKIAKLYDVSAVNVPAYEQTNLQARSFFEVEHSKEIAELEHSEQLKKLDEKRNALLERIEKTWMKKD